MLAGKEVARLVGIDDGGRLRQHLPRQVVVGHDDLDAQFVGPGHARHGGDAVIDGQDEVGAPLPGRVHHRRAQAIAIGKTARHQVGDSLRTHGAQAPHRQGAAGGPVGVIVAHHQDRAPARHPFRQPLRRPIDVQQASRRVQGTQGELAAGRVPHPARQVDAAQQGRQVGGHEDRGRRRRAATDDHPHGRGACLRRGEGARRRDGRGWGFGAYCHARGAYHGGAKRAAASARSPPASRRRTLNPIRHCRCGPGCRVN